jgi:hypothetical protein
MERNEMRDKKTIKSKWSVIGVLIMMILLMCNLFPFIIDNSANNETTILINDTRNFTSNNGNNETNYTQMVLDFIQEHYPNQTVKLSDTWKYVTYETNVSYTVVEATVYYDGIESVDVVTASINHVTKHIEFGREQIQRDYQEYVNSLPIYYQKMESGFRTDIRDDVGFLLTINESKNFSLRYDAVFIINATDLRKMYDAMDIVGAGQEHIEEVNWLYGAKSVRINLTLYQTLFIANHSFVIYLYRESTKYTQMCLDFIQKHYPDETISFYSSNERGTSETGAKYTVVTVYLVPSTNSIVASVNYATNHIEFGQGQIYRDYQEYINSLPRPYQKMDRESRTIIKKEFGYFPIIEEVETLNYRCKVTFFVHATNLSKLTDAINATGETYSDIYDLGPFNGIETREVDANLTFYHVLMLTNESFVKGVWLWDITPYTIEEKRELVDFLLILIIAVLLIVVAIQSFILFRMRKKE